ncbi:MAG: glycosyltransferase family 1 protein [Flavobacterium sp.]|uniref:glycosyltransferase family 4 protein n=1 Tax=Flavobacterium sp. TaxID=239 RepID=UPI00121A6598|nr:glycosyltransferase family 4 protein [Flavobacterium sp.]RZJ66092.1 MAG: glycosyltransferase family 1 protein [Flavobacterium sp.]
MKHLLYIGNKLSGVGKTLTAIEILGPLLESEGFSVVYASSAKKKVVRLWQMLLAVVVNRNKIDFVLIDTYSTSNFWYAYLTGRLCHFLKMKYIPILHGGNLPLRLQRNPVLSRQLFGNAYKNVAPSNYLVQKFADAGFDSVQKIPNPVPTSAIEYTERKNFKPRLLWVRSFSKIYNPQMAIKVIVELKREFPDASLCMVGPDSGSLESVKQDAENFGVSVKFTGRLEKKQWMEMSADYDFFINTSEIDNTPFSLLEAAALGLPVISTNAGGIPYLFESEISAKLVERGDFISMAKSISNCIKNPQKTTEMTIRAREVALESDWRNLRNNWLEILT